MTWHEHGRANASIELMMDGCSGCFDITKNT